MAPTDLDRLAVRERPEGQPIMHQAWGKLLFMHWRIDEKLLRPLVPPGLEIDTFDGSAWIAMTHSRCGTFARCRHSCRRFQD